MASLPRRGLAMLLTAAAVLSQPAAAQPATAQPEAPAAADPVALEVAGRDGSVRRFSLEAIGRLPAVTVAVSWHTGRGQEEGSFSGPLLWTVLEQAGLLDRSPARDRVRQVVTVTGRDGYAIALAVGEIAPDFEAKQVIVATHAEGRPITGYPLRLVVPDDRRPGRAVRDVVGVRLD